MQNNYRLHSLFDKTPELLQYITNSSRNKHYEAGDSIISHGDAASSFYFLLKGWVKLTRQTPDGKETIVGLCSDGDVFGEASLFPHADYPYNASALTNNTELAAIPASVIRSLIAQDVALSSSIMGLLNERTSQARLKLEQMTTMTAAQRLGCFLLRLCNKQENGTRVLQIPVEKHILATYLGMKPETFSRSQQQLKPLGISVSGAKITIEHVDKLRNFVCNSCSESGDCAIEAELDN